MQGTCGQIRAGGDDAGAELQGSPPTQKPLALYSGIVTVAADGSAEITLDIPEFAGTARVMAVAWTATKLGRATIDVRSEEHTSELQSRGHLVCRLLLEKKKKKTDIPA